MQKDYADVITEVCQLLFNAICERESNLAGQVPGLDGNIFQLLRQIGWQLMSMLLSHLSSQVTDDDLKLGYHVHRREKVKYFGLFGPIKVNSPYLWNRQTSQGARPVKNQLGITDGKRSVDLEKALVNLGASQSYQQAARQFEQHYGWCIDRYRLRRAVVKIAPQAEEYVSERLESLKTSYNKPLDERPGVEQILVEMDGCHLRTGIFQLAQTPTQEFTQKRHLQKKERTTEWREVRVGFARELKNKEKRTFVAKMSKYPEVVNQLVSAAIDQGMSVLSNVYAVGDGGNGLRSELQKQFSNLQFILDRCHLKQHLYETAEELGLSGSKKQNLVKKELSLISAGKVQELLTNFQEYLAGGSASAAITAKGSERLARLYKYLQQFYDCINYDRFIELGLPIGSGEIESAHRYIPQQRLKIPGATWHPDNINQMLALRLIKANNWWSDFWKQFIPETHLLAIAA